ncbi:MAG: hypothetical protein WD207_09780, partial [Xanthobacteraceae bacterium]
MKLFRIVFLRSMFTPRPAAYGSPPGGDIKAEQRCSPVKGRNRLRFEWDRPDWGFLPGQRSFGPVARALRRTAWQTKTAPARRRR